MVGALTCWAWAPPGVAPAQEVARGAGSASSQKIAFVDVERIEAGWIEYQVLKRDLDKFLQIDKRDIQQLRQDIEKRGAMLEERKARGEINDQDFENFQRYLAIQIKKVDIYTEIRALIVKDKVEQHLGRANRIVEGVVQKIGEEEGYDLVLDGGNLIGGQPSLDISQKVVNMLNASDLGLTGPSAASNRF